ncbi:MAG: hypothetical protein NXI25_11940, partial [bacterium]|nr:hypothetical protein [bacterium]
TAALKNSTVRLYSRLIVSSQKTYATPAKMIEHPIDHVSFESISINSSAYTTNVTGFSGQLNDFPQRRG